MRPREVATLRPATIAEAVSGSRRVGSFDSPRSLAERVLEEHVETTGLEPHYCLGCADNDPGRGPEGAPRWPCDAVKLARAVLFEPAVSDRSL